MLSDFIHQIKIYPYNYHLIIATPRSKKEIKELEKKWGLRNENDQLCGVFEILHEGWNSIMVIYNFNHKQTITYGMIAHEAIHIMDIIFEKIGHNYLYDNNETGAYLIEWIVDTVMKRLNEIGLDKNITFETQIKSKNN